MLHLAVNEVLFRWFYGYLLIFGDFRTFWWGSHLKLGLSRKRDKEPETDDTTAFLPVHPELEYSIGPMIRPWFNFAGDLSSPYACDQNVRPCLYLERERDDPYHGETRANEDALRSRLNSSRMRRGYGTQIELHLTASCIQKPHFRSSLVTCQRNCWAGDSIVTLLGPNAAALRIRTLEPHFRTYRLLGSQWFS